MIRQRPLEISAVCIVVLLLLIFFAFKPLLLNLHSVNLNLGVKKQEFSKKQEKLDNLKRIKSKLADLKADLQIMQNALPKEADIPALLVSTQSLVSLSGLSLVSFSPPAVKKTETTPSTSAPEQEPGLKEEVAIPQTVTEQTGLSSVSFTLSLQGSYPSFLTFLENVEKNLRPTSIISINLTGGGETDKPLGFSLNLVSFYQK